VGTLAGALVKLMLRVQRGFDLDDCLPVIVFVVEG